MFLISFSRSFLIALLLFFSACSQIENRGYAFDLSDHATIKKDISDVDTVLEVMGSPSFISQIGDRELWVYYSEDSRKFLFFRPDILSRKVMGISFNKNLVSEVNYFTLENENSLSFNSDHTKVQSQEKGFFAEIFGNIGQVRPN